MFQAATSGCFAPETLGGPSVHAGAVVRRSPLAHHAFQPVALGRLKQRLAVVECFDQVEAWNLGPLQQAIEPSSTPAQRKGDPHPSCDAPAIFT
jgi:hypothetical protein